MLVVLDHRNVEPPLPDVAPAAMQPVITLRMGNEEALDPFCCLNNSVQTRKEEFGHPDAAKRFDHADELL